MAPAGAKGVAVEHVPDRLGEFAGDLDRGDLAAALAAMPGELTGEHWLVAGMADGGVSCLDQGPAQVAGPFFRSGPRQSRSPDWSTFGERPV